MRRLAIALTLFAFVPLGACSGSSPGTLDVSPVGTTEDTWSGGQPYVLTAGQAGALATAPKDAKGNTAAITVTATIDDPRVAQVYTTSTANTFVVVGETAGTTNLRFAGGGDAPVVIAVSVGAAGN